MKDNESVSLWKKFALLAIALVISTVIYLVLIKIYILITKNPVIFFASIVICLLLAIGLYFALCKLYKKLFDQFSIFLFSFSIFLVLTMVSIFGPVFIDRSISYSLVFYAVDKGEIDPTKFQKEFTESVFNKRILDAQSAGFIVKNSHNTFTPTEKAKFFSMVMKALGDITSSNFEYRDVVGYTK